MKRILLILAAVLFSGALMRIVGRTANANTAAAKNGVAIVELFSSEGCSSCPPADLVLNDLVHKSADQHSAVYALAFHVDYWDSLGWKDPFGSAAFSARQTQYVRAMKLDSNYTPQMIVNGATEFVGSNRDTADHAIAAALATPLAGELTATVSADSSTSGHAVKIHATSIPANSIINVAVVEDGLQSDVRRGENSGRTLQHEHVVRWFHSVTLPASSSDLSVAIPDLRDVKLDHASVIVYAQQSDNLHVLAAASSTF